MTFATFDPASVGHWDSLDRGKFADERASVEENLSRSPLDQRQRTDVVAEAVALVEHARRSQKKQGVVESFLQEFSLGTREGLALMCLAEALLRTPDEETRDRLIAEKIGSADWASHLGNSESLFVNASTWGLMLTGKLVEADDEAKTDLPGFLKRIAGRLGEPVIRQAVATAVRIMGEQFVVGRTIEGALKRSDREGWLCSFDMLGEGARTAADAERYEHIYGAAIEAVGRTAKGQGPEAGHGVSVKLSALCPRYEATQETRVWCELYPRILRLALIAARHDINFTIDAEEADRLALSLKLLDRLTHEPELGTWSGLGLAVQAYQKRASEVIDRVADLARRSGRRLMVRLVKGAYWDTEIKRAQVSGRTDYPVFTTKAATDLNYLVCARAMIDAAPHLYSQFATHNAHSLAAVHRMAREARDGAGVKIEFQRLHGMGEALYDAAQDQFGPVTVRAYAPVGGHEELLPYLVRRLLENGANSSFVHALLDERVPASAVAGDPISAVEAHPDRHAKIPTPKDMYMDRQNSTGRDYSQAADRARHGEALERLDRERLTSGPIIGGALKTGINAQDVLSPFDGRVLGTASEASAADIDTAADRAAEAQLNWDRITGLRRAPVLRAMADALEGDMDRLVALLAREAGKTLNDGVAEVREAADFLRYYALLAERQFAGPETLKGPVGEINQLVQHGRGVFACISPWNFPLAIFTGQIAAALAAGNAVLAKPAEQTPLIAAEAVRLFYKAGLNPDLLALLPGAGESVGAALVAHPGIDGVAFTGGTSTASAINRSLAARPGAIIPFIAETGGLNGMFVDTTALKEQVIDDVINSAFGSAGQRCSALRILYVPHEAAEALIEGLKGALEAQVVGDPTDPSTDIGPVIDAQSRADLETHVARLSREGRIIARATVAEQAKGHVFAPTIAEIPTPDFLEREVFGPVLHIYRYAPKDLKTVAGKLASRGYGLTLGVHSRIEAFAAEVMQRVPAGNVYINRSITGAVVGVQPFGGEGLSGTGPKAGGPNSLIRFASEKAISNNISAQGGDPALLNL